MITVHVPLGKRSYPIYIGESILADIGSLFVKHRITKTVVVISDVTVSRLYLSYVKKSLQSSGFNIFSIIIPQGEKQKSLLRAEKIFTQLLRWKVERSCTIVALGGGVVGDLSGFIAATYQRGVDFVQIPTTLLAQVDSSVGGKVGINHPLAKNMIGAFYQPKLVIADIGVLKTLPDREIVCGLGEIVKYGIILDKIFFSYINTNLKNALNSNAEVLRRMVKRSCELKAYIVSNDEKEQNLRAILNFGHTIGHSLEHAGHFSKLKHGEAILYGMIAETELAYRKKLISSADQHTIEKTVKTIRLPKLSDMKLTPSALLNTMRLDKKVQSGKIRMVLPFTIGKVSLPIVVTQKEILHAIQYLKEYAS